MLLPSTRSASQQSTMVWRDDARHATTYGTRKILSVQGSFTLVPDAKPLTSTYLPSLSNGLKTYPGLPGTNFPVGNAVDEAEARVDATLDDDCAVSPRVVREVAPDVRLWPRSASTRGCCCDADAISGGGIEDRKSTRLNSSHRCISYAVFCLKKKNKNMSKMK